jgi:integrase/recombinase XerC
MGHVTAAHAAINVPQFAPTTRYLAVVSLRRTVRNLATYGAPYGLMEAAPRLPRPAPRPNTVSDEQLAMLLSSAPPHLQLYLLLCHDCALRGGTAARVSWSNLIDTALLTIRSKRSTIVRVPISGRLATLISLCPKGDGTLVSLLAGHRVGHSALHQHFKRVLAHCGLPMTIRLHDLRRTMAEKTYRLTSDLRVVQTLLGHDSLGSTLQYLQRPAHAYMDALAASIETITGAKG